MQGSYGHNFEQILANTIDTDTDSDLLRQQNPYVDCGGGCGSGVSPRYALLGAWMDAITK